jgi:hypothetical protein
MNDDYTELSGEVDEEVAMAYFKTPSWSSHESEKTHYPKHN